MNTVTASLDWQVQLPLLRKENINLYLPENTWRKELSQMRGFVLFDGGRRPAFQRADGTFDDTDSLDGLAYHLLVRSSNLLIGCVRVMPLITSSIGLTESLFGHQEFEQILLQIGSTRSQTCEGSRWMVMPEYRSSRVSLGLVAGAIVISRWLGFKIMIVMAGTRDGQDCLLIHTGFQPLVGIKPLHIPLFKDELRLLYYDIRQKPKSLIAGRIEKMTELIGKRFAIAIPN